MKMKNLIQSLISKTSMLMCMTVLATFSSLNAQSIFENQGSPHTITDGIFNSGVTALNTGTELNILGGVFNGIILASGGSEIFIKGGDFGSHLLDPNSSLSLSGKSTIELFGSNFKIDGTLTDDLSLGHKTVGDVLSGNFADGSSFSFNIGDYGGSKSAILLTAVPEPSTYAAILGALGLLFVINKSRKRRVA